MSAKGVENSGGGETYRKTPPQKRLSVKVRRGRREGDGTENVMTERPSHARWFFP